LKRGSTNRTPSGMGCLGRKAESRVPHRTWRRPAIAMRVNATHSGPIPVSSRCGRGPVLSSNEIWPRDARLPSGENLPLGHPSASSAPGQSFTARRAGSTRGPRAPQHAAAPGQPTSACVPRFAGISYARVPTRMRRSHGGARLIIVRSVVRIHPEAHESPFDLASTTGAHLRRSAAYADPLRRNTVSGRAMRSRLQSRIRARLSARIARGTSTSRRY
jgi:hypothetical protein